MDANWLEFGTALTKRIVSLRLLVHLLRQRKGFYRLFRGLLESKMLHLDSHLINLPLLVLDSRLKHLVLLIKMEALLIKESDNTLSVKLTLTGNHFTQIVLKRHLSQFFHPVL